MAHPDWNNYVAPYSLEERLLQVAEAKRSLGTSIPWLCDAMDNRLTKAMGRAPNSEFILGPDGNILQRHGWNRPERLRRELAELVGRVDSPTRPEDLGLPSPQPVAAAPTGVVPRIQREERMVPLDIEPIAGADGEEFYAKLRAEVTRDVLRDGKGTLYLGFLLDPLYKVHWNNLVAPIHLELASTDAVDLSTSSLDGPQVDAAGDADPREFLVEVHGWPVEAALTVSVSYFACSDEAGWCKPIKQAYRVHRKRAGGAGFTFRPEYRERMKQSLRWRDGDLPVQTVAASPNEIAELVGDWSMKTSGSGRSRRWKLHLDYSDGRLTGWSTFDRADPDIYVVSFRENVLRYLQLAGPSPEEVVLSLGPDGLSGTQLSPFGNFELKGVRETAKAEDN